MTEIWVGIDTGGTFTDFVLLDPETGARWLHKAPTTPADPARGILDGLADALSAAGAEAAEVGALVHGTTLATNAVLEGAWARTGMVTTAGFRDVLDLARQRRPSFFNLDVGKPAPPAPRTLRIEAAERLAPDGDVVTPLDEAAVETAAATLRDAGCRAVAICFLHAYANPAHERRAVEIVR
ncbi:MAG: hydantoinase/oxoprolinase N-terminal domain-containing protein, partial [Alphaproteobacteria bacterium]